MTLKNLKKIIDGAIAINPDVLDSNVGIPNGKLSLSETSTTPVAGAGAGIDRDKNTFFIYPEQSLTERREGVYSQSQLNDMLITFAQFMYMNKYDLSRPGAIVQALINFMGAPENKKKKKCALKRVHKCKHLLSSLKIKYNEFKKSKRVHPVFRSHSRRENGSNDLR